MDGTVVARNLLLLLISLSFAPEEASVIMLHLWYSAFLPEDMINIIKKNISTISGHFPNLGPVKGPTELLEGKWTHNNVTLRAKLNKEEWDRVLSYFHGKSTISLGDAKKLRESAVLAPSETDDLHRNLFKLPPPCRVAKMKFREYGILLPFGAPCEKFIVPNPSVYRLSFPVFL